MTNPLERDAWCRPALLERVWNWFSLPEQEQNFLKWAWASKKDKLLADLYGFDSDSDHINSNSRTCDR